LDEEPKKEYKWLQVNLDPIIKKIIASICRNIIDKNDPIRYGLPYQPPYFSDDTYQYIERPLGQGVTCATFVLEVFRMAAVVLLDTDTWPNADADDLSWEARISLAQKDQELGAAMAQYVGCKRYRPQDVAAGSILEPRPVTFDAARPVAEQIIEELKKAA
jgi:hypothetical protein